MRRFTLPNLFLTVEGEDDEEPDDTEKTEEDVYHHKDTPRSSPREVKDVELGEGSPSSPRTPASPRRLHHLSNHCPVHCPHKTKLVQEELGNRVAAETVPEEEEEEIAESGEETAGLSAALSHLSINSTPTKTPRSDDGAENSDDASTEPKNNEGDDEGREASPREKTSSANDDENSTTRSDSDDSAATSTSCKTPQKMARVPKSPKSPRSPVSPRYMKMFQRSGVPLAEDAGGRSSTSTAGLVCTCPNSCVQDFGIQEVPARTSLAFGECLRARIDGYRRQDSGVVGVPREKRSHSLAAPGSLELPGCRRGFRPEALLVRSGTGAGTSLVKAKFKNRHQLSVQASLEFSDDAAGFPGTPPPQATPPVHKDIPIMTSKIPKNKSKDYASLTNQLTIDSSMLGRTSSWEDYFVDEGSKSDNEIEKSSTESSKKEITN